MGGCAHGRFRIQIKFRQKTVSGMQKNSGRRQYPECRKIQTEDSIRNAEKTQIENKYIRQ